MACLFWVMPVFTNILVAIDGSEASDHALEQAVDEAKVWNAKLHAVYVVETGLFSSLPSDSTVEIMYGALESEGNAVLEKAKKTAAKSGVVLVTHMKRGHAGTEIIADMLVKDYMTSDVVNVDIPGNRDDVLKILKRTGISGVPVLRIRNWSE